MQGQAAEQFPCVLAGFDQGGLFLVELVLNLPDQLFENIFEGEHAAGAAVLIDDDSKVQFSFEERLQQVFEAGGFGRINKFGRGGQKIGAAPGAEAQGIGAVDVEDA